MRRFLEPRHLRKVALFLLVGWFIPFLGAMGALAFSLPGEVHDLRGKATDEHGRKKSTNTNRKETAGQREKRTSHSEESSLSNRSAAVKMNNTQTTTGREAHQGKSTTSDGVETVARVERKTAGDTHTNTGAGADGKPGGQRRENDTDRTQNANLNLLARVIYAEARGEPLEGQVAVGAVLLNRLKSPRFPNNLWGIIFKKGEFCTVRDGQIWMNPNAQAYRAARLALSGWDPTHGALYFYNPAKTTSKWIWSRPVTTRIGSHIFAR